MSADRGPRRLCRWRRHLRDYALFRRMEVEVGIEQPRSNILGTKQAIANPVQDTDVRTVGPGYRWVALSGLRHRAIGQVTRSNHASDYCSYRRETRAPVNRSMT
jgi:hypothetical protein